MEEELKNLKKILEPKNLVLNKNSNDNQVNEDDMKNFLNNFLNEFEIENKKLIIYNQTKNNLIENAIKNEFQNHCFNIKNIFEENIVTNSKAYKIIENLNYKIEELFGYKAKAERYQSQTEMLLNEQKILQDQIKVYRKIVSETSKIKEIQNESIKKYKLNEDLHNDIIKKTKKYIKSHFSVGVQKELFKLLENN